MRYQTTSALEFEVGRRRAAAPAKRGGRFLLIAVALSVCVHLAALVLVVSVPRLLPKEASPKEEGTVELLMVEQKGTRASQANESKPAPVETTSQPNESKPPPAEKTDPAKVEERQAAAAPPPPPTPLAQGDEPAPPPAEPAEPKAKPDPAPPVQKEALAQPVPPRPQAAPVFDLDGTESESNAFVLGGHVLPASRDDRFRNRPPPYPIEAEERGEHGAVTLMIHVSENGVATGVDVLESSGYDVLDQAAVAAVRKWHFRPALKEGRSIPFDMPFRFIFESN